MMENGKVVDLKTAVSWIHDGAHLCMSGFAHSLAPLAFVREMIRQGIKDLEFSAIGEVWAVDFLSGANAIAQVRLSNFMFEGWGRARNFSRGVESCAIKVEDYSHFGITNRFFAASIGLPFMPTKVMNGTDISQVRSFDGENKMREFDCPFTDEKLVLVPKVQPDYAVIHASRADCKGNVQLFGISSTADLIAKAAKKVIVTVEEIVEEEVLRKDPTRTLIPGIFVDAVVHVPYGAHPAGMFNYYDYDSNHIDSYIQASRTVESFKAYLQEYVYGVHDHFEYLRKIGIKQLLSLRADPYFGYSLESRGVL